MSRQGRVTRRIDAVESQLYMRAVSVTFGNIAKECTPIKIQSQCLVEQILLTSSHPVLWLCLPTYYILAEQVFSMLPLTASMMGQVSLYA
jgi:hypothetical protein